MARPEGHWRAAVAGPRGHPVHAVLTARLLDAGAALVALDGSPVDLVVHLPEPATEGTALLDTDEAAWDAAAERPARDFLATLQAAHPGLVAAGGRLVVVLPSAPPAGAPGLVAATTGWAAVRLLARSAARRWAGDGVAVTTVTHRRDGDEAAVAGAVLFLTDSPVTLNGQTIAVDRGLTSP